VPLAEARKLLKPRMRRQSGLFLAEGPHVIGLALDARVEVCEAFACAEIANAAAAAVVDRLRAAGVRVRDVGSRALREVADTSAPQGVVAVVREPVSGTAAWTVAGVHLVLAGVQDPGNAGTLVRAAEALGARSVLGLPGTTDLFGARAVRAGQGAHLHVPIAQSEAAEAALDSLVDAGGELWGADAGGEDVSAVAPPALLALALGGEAQGLPEPLLRRAIRTVGVVQRGRVGSLNVAMAGSVLLASLVRASAQGA